MDAVRIGLWLRALRIRRGWRQIDVATHAGVSRGTVSKAERGHLGGVSLEALGEVAVEVTFSIWSERGSFDVLALHPPSGSLLAVEVKTVVSDFQAMIAGLDRKARLAPQVAAARGWRATRTSRLLVVEAGSTARDRIRRLDAANAALPHRGRQVRSWLENPSGSLAGLLFVRSTTQGDRSQRAAGRQRVRRPRIGRNETEAGTPEPSAQANAPARA